MTFRLHALLASALSLCSLPALAFDFTGEWGATVCENGKNKSCGGTSFTLLQKGNRICGDHMFYKADGGAVNEGMHGSVRGTVVGNTAVLVVTSGRNGSIVLGKASVARRGLRWEILEEIIAGHPAGDALIYTKGPLERVSGEIGSALQAACR